MDVYPYDTGDPSTTAAEVELCDDYGACAWDEIELDNSSGDPQTVIDSIKVSGRRGSTNG
jgi:hypothetical protein